jgi:iron complex transport system ATP-binding protein
MALFLEMENVNVARGESVVLHDINLKIQAGEHVAILGPNGCGKSTLIKTMTCECYPLALEGTRVAIFGRERWDLTELKKRLGVVSAELPGKQTLKTTGRDAVLTGFFSSSAIWPNLVVTDAMRIRAEEVLELVGASGFAGKPVGEMSAGQQRRIMIGRALVGSRASTDDSSGAQSASEMLLLDEPSNALDLAAQQELREMLRRLARQGTGILLITHHIADILPEINRAILMREGRIVADGAKETLLTGDVLSELFGARVEVKPREGYYHAW